MRSFILGIVILMAAPEFAVGQQREEKSDDAAASRASRERRSTPGYAEAVRARLRGQLPQLAGIRLTNPRPRIPPNPNAIVPPDHGHRRPGHRVGDDRLLRYRRPHSGTNVVFVPYAAPVVVKREVVVERQVIDGAASVPRIVEPPLLARLILDIQPPGAQVFSDGYYIGIPEDFRFENGGAVLEPGPHRIDILARGYEPVSFDVNLTRGQSATFRHILTPLVRAPQPAPPAAAVKAPPVAKAPATFYLIPGCYMGNVPPKEANLPATCDVARAVTFQY